jgi:hypothetical protein
MKSNHHQLLVVVHLPWVECQITECVTGFPTTLVPMPVVDLPTQIVPLVALQHARLGERSLTICILVWCVFSLNPLLSLDVTKFPCLLRNISCTWYPEPLSMIFLWLGASSNVKSLHKHFLRLVDGCKFQTLS